MRLRDLVQVCKPPSLSFPICKMGANSHPCFGGRCESLGRVCRRSPGEGSVGLRTLPGPIHGEAGALVETPGQASGLQAATQTTHGWRLQTCSVSHGTPLPRALLPSFIKGSSVTESSCPRDGLGCHRVHLAMERPQDLGPFRQSGALEGCGDPGVVGGRGSEGSA